MTAVLDSLINLHLHYIAFTLHNSYEGDRATGLNMRQGEKAVAIDILGGVPVSRQSIIMQTEITT